MKKISLLFIFALTMLFVGCGSVVKDELPIFDTENQPTVIWGNANDSVLTYYVNSKFNKSGDYTLELSVSIPNKDGTSNLKVLNSKVFKVVQDSNLLVDGILINEIENKVKEETTINYKDLEYQIDIYRGAGDSKSNGVGSKWKLFDTKNNQDHP